MKKSIEIKRKLEIEDKLEELKIKSIVDLANEGYSLEELNYILRAILMPLNEMSEYIEIYDTSRPRIDELEFVCKLCSKYQTDSKTLISRIREVRRINNYRNINGIPKR